jgi:N-acetyl-anhydromuramyl-L-alanine amidase AmpD
VQTPAGAFRAYHTYMDSLRDWCDLVMGMFGNETIAHALARYVPGDSHGPNTYAHTVLRRIAEWDAASGEFEVPGTSDSRGLEAAPAGAPKWVGCNANNYWAGRQGHTIIAIVNHEMQGTMEGTRQAFQDPSHGASAHYGVGKDGAVVQYIKDEDTAWANGPIRNPNTAAMPWLADAQRNGSNPNRMTITIEWEGSHTGSWHKVDFNGESYTTLDPATIQKWWAPTEEQYQAGLALIRDLCARHNIPTDRAHIGRHSDVDNVTKWFCPGQGFPLQRVLDDLNGQTGGGPLTDAPLTGAASISEAAFTQALSDAGSPALQEATGADYYNMCVSNGVDPAVALAFFGQTSAYGTMGDAATRKNWGNLWDAGANAFGTYGAWREGLADWLHRLQTPAYTAGGTPTVTRIVPIYRGANAQNPDNATYTSQLLARISALRGA